MDTFTTYDVGDMSSWLADAIDEGLYFTSEYKELMHGVS